MEDSTNKNISDLMIYQQLNETIEQLRKENTDLKVENAKLQLVAQHKDIVILALNQLWKGLSDILNNRHKKEESDYELDTMLGR